MCVCVCCLLFMGVVLVADFEVFRIMHGKSFVRTGVVALNFEFDKRRLGHGRILQSPSGDLSTMNFSIQYLLEY